MHTNEEKYTNEKIYKNEKYTNEKSMQMKTSIRVGSI